MSDICQRKLHVKSPGITVWKQLEADEGRRRPTEMEPGGSRWRQMMAGGGR
jgi:hypothetical protein